MLRKYINTFKARSQMSVNKHYLKLSWLSVKAGMWNRELNEDNDGNAGNYGGNVGNHGWNA